VTPELLAGRGSCPEPSGPGVDHTADITADETWAAADGPHRIPNSIAIEATVSVEACAIVLLGADVYVAVGDDDVTGRLVATGEVTTDADGTVDVRPVHFDAIDPTQPWAQISAEPMGTIELSVAALMHGGSAPINAPGALLLRGVAGGTNGGAVIRNGTVDRVLVSDAVGHAVNLDGYAGFTEDSAQLWILRSGSDDEPAAVRVEPGIAYTLPAELVIDDNVADEILVETSKAFMGDDTWRDHGVRYRVRSPLYVNPHEDGPAVTLTIDPGVTVAFDDFVATGIYVGTSEQRLGNLVADGTAEQPIVFTSASPSPAAGAWLGIYFRYYELAAPSISHARFEYAGGDSGYSGFGCSESDNDSAIIIEGQGEDDAGPAEAFVHDCEFDEIAGGTVIVSGWSGAAAPDFSAVNSFGAATPACRVSQPRRPPGEGGDSCEGRDMCWG
ncbi:MAG: hypothetical protein IAG13_35860, partial [Deltaproteobacteria bacterium]|nr:hypothetical protein [Nannocystaceae bacterium]